MRINLALAFITLFVLAACNEQTNNTEVGIQETATPVATIGFDITHYEIDPEISEIAENFPNVANSTSAQPLWQAIMCSMFNMPCHWDSFPAWTERFYQPEQSHPYSEEFLDFMSKHIVATGTHDAYLSLIDGRSDIILVARQPSEDELNVAKAKSVGLDIQPVALDAFVFIVNVHNSVDDLSLKQIRGMYTGDITNWSEVGGSDKAIQIYQRNDNSGSQELMKSLVMRELPMIDAPEDMVLFGMTGPYSVLSSGHPGVDGGDSNGIAYTVYFYAKNIAQHDDIEFIAIDGVEPTQATIANGRYPLTTEVYVVVREDEATDSTAVQLRDWLLSDKGWYPIQESGYVPLPKE